MVLLNSKKVPEEILLPIALKYRGRIKADPERWDSSEFEQLRHDLGPQYAGVPLDDLRRQCCNLRKAGKLGKLHKGAHGAARKSEPPQWYKDYLLTPEWKSFRRRVLEFWQHRCAFCNDVGRLDVHHRTYDRLHVERLNDCIALCRQCHLAADRQRQRAQRNAKADSLSVLFA